MSASRFSSFHFSRFICWSTLRSLNRFTTRINRADHKLCWSYIEKPGHTTWTKKNTVSGYINKADHTAVLKFQNLVLHIWDEWYISFWECFIPVSENTKTQSYMFLRTAKTQFYMFLQLHLLLLRTWNLRNLRSKIYLFIYLRTWENTKHDHQFCTDATWQCCFQNTGKNYIDSSYIGQFNQPTKPKEIAWPIAERESSLLRRSSSTKNRALGTEIRLVEPEIELWYGSS
jgi:hypothetical protein